MEEEAETVALKNQGSESLIQSSYLTTHQNYKIKTADSTKHRVLIRN